MQVIDVGKQVNGQTNVCVSFVPIEKNVVVQRMMIDAKRICNHSKKLHSGDSRI